jgi:hypothetical protein
VNPATYDGIFLAPESIVVFPGLAASALKRYTDAAASRDDDEGSVSVSAFRDLDN